MFLLVPGFIPTQIFLVLLAQLVAIDVEKLLQAITANGEIVQVTLLKNPRNSLCNACLQQPNSNPC